MKNAPSTMRSPRGCFTARSRLRTTDLKPSIDAATALRISLISYSSFTIRNSETNSANSGLSRVTRSFLGIDLMYSSTVFSDLVGNESSAATCCKFGRAPSQNSPMSAAAKNSSVSRPAVSLKNNVDFEPLRASMTRTELGTARDPHPVRCVNAL